ncbi:MAG TPA: hypothetical protein VHC19_22955, partial [Pirellulales bacterium]|nr:hypothetical protein [Pirellulales bacterium]
SEARALSDELTINEEHPLHEIELHFVEGAPFAVQVLGPDGSPASGIPLQFEYTSPTHQSTSRARKATGPDGRFVFEHVDPQLPGHYSLAVGPGEELCGASLKVDDPTVPLTVQLEQGQSLQGVLIDRQTQQPIADVRIMALLASGEYDRARYYGLISTRSDAAGHFEFHNLESLRYRLVVYGVNKLEISGPGATPGENGETVVQPGQDASVTVAITRSEASAPGGD